MTKRKAVAAFEDGFEIKSYKGKGKGRAMAHLSLVPTPMASPTELVPLLATADDSGSKVAAPEPRNVEPLIAPIVVHEMDAKTVTAKIEDIAINAVANILAGRGFGFALPRIDQGSGKARDGVLGGGCGSGTSNGDAGQQEIDVSPRRVAAVIRVLELAHGALRRGIHLTRRDIFFADPGLFGEPKSCSGALDDISRAVGCTHGSLNVVSVERGIVAGCLTFKEDGDLIDCSKMGIGGKAIPPFLGSITQISSDAEFVLVVQKEDAFMRLAEDRFCRRHHCIIVAARSVIPDAGTRMLLKRLKRELDIPILMLTDADPQGVTMLAAYTSAAMASSPYEVGAEMALSPNEISWLGLRPREALLPSPSPGERSLVLPEACRVDMTELEVRLAKELLEAVFVKENPAWRAEVEAMVAGRKKVELQALSALGLQYLTKKFLPQKIVTRDWI